MLELTPDGMVHHTRVTIARRLGIERIALTAIHGIIVHQTGAPTAESSLSSYMKPGANGAHFLIDKNGGVFQTASIYMQTWHVGKLKSRCLAESHCSPVETKLLKQSFNPSAENKREMAKAVPERYPANIDSIGIELVGGLDAKTGEYEFVTEEQNKALAWLVKELSDTFNVPMTEVFRHPTVSRKTPSEAATAKW